MQYNTYRPLSCLNLTTHQISLDCYLCFRLQIFKLEYKSFLMFQSFESLFSVYIYHSMQLLSVVSSQPFLILRDKCMCILFIHLYLFIPSLYVTLMNTINLSIRIAILYQIIFQKIPNFTKSIMYRRKNICCCITNISFYFKTKIMH